jgi:hypothetical protein
VTSAQSAAFAALAIAIVALFVLVITGVPQIARLLFRKRMEVIRDDLVDAILDDKVRETRSVQRFLKAAEAGTNLPRRLTLARIYALAKANVDSGIDMKAVSRRPQFSDLEPAERELMRDLDSRLCRAYVSYLSWASPSALVLNPLLTLIGRVRRSGETVKAGDALPAVARESLRAGTAQQSSLIPPRFFAAGTHHHSHSAS